MREKRRKTMRSRIIIMAYCIYLDSSKEKSSACLPKVRIRNIKDMLLQITDVIQCTNRETLLHFTESGKRLALLMSGRGIP